MIFVAILLLWWRYRKHFLIRKVHPEVHIEEDKVESATMSPFHEDLKDSIEADIDDTPSPENPTLQFSDLLKDGGILKLNQNETNFD